MGQDGGRGVGGEENIGGRRGACFVNEENGEQGGKDEDAYGENARGIKV